MSEPQSPAPNGNAPQPPAPASSRLAPAPKRSCLSRIFGFVGWLLTLVLSAALAIAALAALAFYGFGFTLQTPTQVLNAPATAAALSEQYAAAQAEVGTLQTTVAEQNSRASNDGERIDDLETRLAAVNTTIEEVDLALTEIAQQAEAMAALGRDLDEGIALAATLQAQSQADQVQIQVFATIQAANSTRLDDLQRQGDRLTRFLERLGDIVGDAEADLANTPIPTSPTLAPADETVTPTATPTAAP